MLFRLPALLLSAVLMCAAVPDAVAQTAVPTQEGWVAARQGVTTADGLAMTYVEAGDPAGPPLILLHGYTDNARSWSLLAPLLTGRRLLMLDLRGHGGTAAPPCCYGMDSLAHDVAGFMDAMGIARADVVGHSMGSTTAAVLAGFYPEKVNRLVLISTTIEVPAAGGDWLWANVPGLPDVIDPDSEFMMAWYWNPNPVPADFIDRERAESAATPRQTWMGVLRAFTMMDLSQVAPKVQAPVLILWGDQDSLFDASTQAAVKAAYPAAQYETFAGFGHNMFWETPGAVADRINAFLAAP